MTPLTLDHLVIAVRRVVHLEVARAGGGGSGIDVVRPERDGVEPLAGSIEPLLECAPPGRVVGAGRRGEEFDVAVVEAEEDVGGAVGRVAAAP